MPAADHLCNPAGQVRRRSFRDGLDGLPPRSSLAEARVAAIGLAARARRACAARSYLGCTLGLGMRVSVLYSVLELAAQITSPPQVPTP